MKHTYLFSVKLLQMIINGKWLNSSIWPEDETLTGTYNPGKCSGNERVFQISPNFGSEASLPDAI